MNTNEMCDYDFLNWAQGHFSEDEWERLCDLIQNSYWENEND